MNTSRTDTALSVLQLCAPSSFGGLERVVQGLAIGLARRGHRVSVLGVHTPGADLTEFFAPFGSGDVNALPLSIGARNYLAERRAVAQFLESHRFDVVHVHGYRPDILHNATIRNRGIRVVSTLHGSGDFHGLARAYGWLHERVLRRSDAVIAVSEEIASEMRGRISPRRLHTVPNAWVPLHSPLDRESARSTLGIPHDATVIGWVGRLARVKGADLLIQALAQLRERGWIACIVGDGRERGALEAQVAEHGLRDHVRFVGAVANAGRLARAFDIFALSSRSEGTPIALLEAVAAGVPVVSFGVGGVPQVLADGEEAWICVPGAPNDLAAAMDTALANPEERRRRSRAASGRLARDFDPGPWLAQHEEIYRPGLAGG